MMYMSYGLWVSLDWEESHQESLGKDETVFQTFIWVYINFLTMFVKNFESSQNSNHVNDCLRY